MPVSGKIGCGDLITAEENIDQYRNRSANNFHIEIYSI